MEDSKKVLTYPKLSLFLSEIKKIFASKSHVHNYAGSSSSGGSANTAVKLGTPRTINGISFDGTKNIEVPNSYSKQLSNEDLNTIKSLGNYFSPGGNTVKNKPTNVQNFGLEVYKIASGHILQRLHGSNNIIYYRFYNGTAWTKWENVYSSNNKPSASDIGAASTSHTHTVNQITNFPNIKPITNEQIANLKNL